ncbi:hypothetical protein HUT19_18670 [Streptomyces sp. NA02950]|uniref:hypothetical protein n=1 Tax=Streptomyces sp. NA02950 TaxID=2742137 RepID=UPI001591930A|nr:hypothetical protein [Streptomyces sp. NA02950]QKV93537.1 hypothetical protein HUT19_18670 [Streptomyces sp. NA02950]
MIKALILCLGLTVTGYLELLAYVADPAGPWDTETVFHSKITSCLAPFSALFTAQLTRLFIRAEWLRHWWRTVLLLLLTLAALLRLTALAPRLGARERFAYRPVGLGARARIVL